MTSSIRVLIACVMLVVATGCSSTHSQGHRAATLHDQSSYVLDRTRTKAETNSPSASRYQWDASSMQLVSAPVQDEDPLLAQAH